MALQVIESKPNFHPAHLTDEAEIESLLEGIFSQYGYDFRGYSRTSLKRRISHALIRSGCRSIPEMEDRLLRDPVFFRELVSNLTVNVTEMFRDPQVYLTIRKEVIPVLRTYPSIRIWHAGCSTGEEVYSMAILLQEEGLYDRTLLYATDISQRALITAKEGIYQASQIQSYTSNYQHAGGIESFSDYYTAKYGSVKMNSSLQRNIVFSPHNLATDEVFSEFHMVFCRNVLIYFDRKLQRRAIHLFHRSMVRRGYLCLGTKETVELSGMEGCFEAVRKEQKLYRKLEPT